MSAGLTIEDMSVGWGEQRVIPSLELELAPGECLCLVGPGGSGKSTIVRVVEQLVRSELRASEAQPLWWRGYYSSSFAGCLRLRQHGEFVRRPIAELLERAGLLEREGWMPEGSAERELLRAVYDLPLGEAPELLRRFLSFVLVAWSDAPLLLLDEPLFGLAGTWRRCVWARLEALSASSRSIILVTHYLPLARAIGDRVTLIVDGEVIESAAVEDFFERAEHPRTRQFLTWGG